MTDSDRNKLHDDLLVLLGIASSRYGMSKKEFADTLGEMKEEVESGRYDVHFAAGRGAQDKNS